MIDVVTIGVLFVVVGMISWLLYGAGKSYNDFQVSVHELHMAKARMDKAISEAIEEQSDEQI